MIDSPSLLADLKKQLKKLEADLRARSEEPGLAWAASLRAEYDRAFERGRTAHSWTTWREGELSQAAVAWIIASTFIRFSEDNALLNGAREDGRQVNLPWMAGPAAGVERAVENQNAFYAAHPTMNGRDWLQSAFRVLASLPAGRGLVDPKHNPVWSVEISATAADSLLAFWRDTNVDGDLVHDFTDDTLDTRFLGDLYQDLSDYAKKTFALLQTPDFIEEFILDRSLTPSIEEFGLEGLKLIDPTCGSGHFLLGAFARLDAAWRAHSPAMEARARVQKALDSIHGVDLNPFAVAIARFRLTIAALKATEERSLVSAPAFNYKLAVGDSLLRWSATSATLDFGDEDETFAYSSEDVREYVGILERGQYHVVVGNPPYIQVKDKALNERYREIYSTCSGKYALSVPFMELFFQLARQQDAAGGAGYVGKITSNSFMKREFGKKVIGQFLSGEFNESARVDLTGVVDTSGAYIPGHGTPTVILFGRRRKPLLPTVRAALGVRGEPAQPSDPANGLVWRDIVDHLDEPGYNGTYTSITDLERATLSVHPWSLRGGGAGELKEILDSARHLTPADHAFRIGVFGIMGADDAFVTTADQARRTEEEVAYRPLVVGDTVRDFGIRNSQQTFFPYSSSHELQPLNDYPSVSRKIWRLRTELGNRATFSKLTYFKEGRPWYEWHQLPKDEGAHSWAITWAEIATHNHFVLDHGGSVFKQTAPVIKLPTGATEEDHYDLLGILNSSMACFWLKQVSHNKGSTVDTKGARQTQVPWEDFYAFNATKLKEFPLPRVLPRSLSRRLDDGARSLSRLSPASLASEGDQGMELSESVKANWLKAKDLLVFLQEELDWEVYAEFGLIDGPLGWSGEAFSLPPEARAFEIQLARNASSGGVVPAWFERHRREPITEFPAHWPAEYRDLVERRLDVIANNPQIRLLEQPEYKRRWATPSWESQLAEAARELALDRLESREYWHDAQGRPAVRSSAQLADLTRNDEVLRGALEILAGSTHVELQPAIESLMAGESVPHLAAQRYKPSGLAKFREWQRVWDLQRRQDRGEQVTIPVPPKYGPADFQKTTYWKARGKLDVPKERFIAYPGAARANDASSAYGWAGWDHAAQGLGLSVLIGDMAQTGATVEQLTPLLGGVVELEPWIHQWHADVDSTFGQSPAAAITGMLEANLSRHGLTRDNVTAWMPSVTTRRRRAAPVKTSIIEEEVTP